MDLSVSQSDLIIAGKKCVQNKKKATFIKSNQSLQYRTFVMYLIKISFFLNNFLMYVAFFFVLSYAVCGQDTVFSVLIVQFYVSFFFYQVGNGESLKE